VTAKRRYSRCIEDPDFFLVSDNDEDIDVNDANDVEDFNVETKSSIPEENSSKKKKSVVLFLGAASTMGMVIAIIELAHNVCKN
jgi:hypothetical protein